jgi:tight adherence protein B
MGARAGIVLAAAAAFVASRSLVWRRTRFRRRLDAGTSGAALALADALEAGHSVRGALTVAGQGLEGPIALEFRALARELQIGGETDSALERLRMRARSRRIDLIVAAVRIQRRSGGGLATLLRGVATTIEEHERLEAEARAASAQARFTSLIVLILPMLGLVLGEFASPGMLGRMTDSAAGIWLLGTALVLQLSGLLLVRRLSRVRD